MAKKSAFSQTVSIRLDRDMVRRLDLLIEDDAFVSYSHGVRRALKEWIKRHKGSRYLYLPIEQLESEEHDTTKRGPPSE